MFDARITTTNITDYTTTLSIKISNVLGAFIRSLHSLCSFRCVLVIKVNQLLINEFSVPTNLSKTDYGVEFGSEFFFRWATSIIKYNLISVSIYGAWHVGRVSREVFFEFIDG